MPKVLEKLHHFTPRNGVCVMCGLYFYKMFGKVLLSLLKFSINLKEYQTTVGENEHIIAKRLPNAFSSHFTAYVVVILLIW